ncbi:hypothetical protein K2X33_13305 [bacterium]|nr:hypothetical protein [bacterium]
MLNPYTFSVVLAIGANVSYHLCMKYTHPEAHPLGALAVSYLVAAASCLAYLVFFGESLRASFTHLNWAPIALGFSICFLELGFLLAYRSGWNISLAALYVNVAVGLILLPIGIWVFRDKLSAANLLGVGFALVGLLLLGKR